MMKVFDEDLQGDELVGSLLFNLKDCMAHKVFHSNFIFLIYNYNRMVYSFGRMYMELH